MNRQKSRATASGEWVVRLCHFRPDLAGLSCFWSPFSARGTILPDLAGLSCFRSPFSARGTNFASSLLLRLKCFCLYRCVRPGMLPALLNVHHLFLVYDLTYFPHVFDSRNWRRATWTSFGKFEGSMCLTMYISQYSIGKMNYIMFRIVYCAFNRNPMLCASLINHTCQPLLLRFALCWPAS